MLGQLEIAKFCGALVALTCGIALPAFARDDAKWIIERAELFSQVCLAAAPTFSSFDTEARNAGFKQTNDGLLYEPEVFVSLVPKAETCSCYMTVGAPNQTAMVQAMFSQMLSDFPDTWQPKSKTGPVNDTTFRRDGVDVRVVLKPAEIDGNTWVAASVIAPGACPK
jgi:hypothetical protein